MQKYQTCLVLYPVTVPGKSEPYVQAIKPNTKEHRIAAYTGVCKNMLEVGEFLNELSDQGWQVVSSSLTSSKEGGACMWTLIRPYDDRDIKAMLDDGSFN